MSDSEIGICDICGEKKPLTRTYFHYDIKCECHSPKHSECIWHCKDCKPKEPTITSVIIKTDELKNNLRLARIGKEAEKEIKSCKYYEVCGKFDIMSYCVFALCKMVREGNHER